MKKVAIIGIVGLPAQYGGFESFTEQIVQRLWDQYEITVYCQKSAFKDHPSKIGKVHLKYLPLKANGIQSILYDMWSILDALRYADTLLILGVGGCPLLSLLRFLGCHKKIIVNIDGIEWKRDKWSKLARSYLHYAEKSAVYYADEIVGDNQVIVSYIQESYHRSCHLIEYGADHRRLKI